MTTVTPPFTGSYGSTLQGLNVTTFERFGMSVAPKMGRSDMPKVLLSSSTGVIDVTPANTNFFDDSLKLPQPISFQPIVGKMATGSIEMSAVAAATDTITLTSTDGRQVMYIAAAARNFVLNTFAVGLTAADSVASLMSVITASQGHATRLNLAGSGSATLYLSQSLSGEDGDNTITVAAATPANYTVSGFVGGVGAPGAVTKDGATYLATNQQVIGEDSYRVIELPQYQLNRQTFGLEPLFTQQYPFVEMDEFDPVKYIREPLTMAWPVVMENPSPIDPFDFNGAIEPFSLRRPLAGFSTFLGSSEDPEPTGIRASVTSGMIQSVFYKKSTVSSNFYFPISPEIEPFEQIGAEEAYGEPVPPAFRAIASVIFTGLPAWGETITLQATDGTSQTYTAVNKTDVVAADAEFSMDDDIDDTASSLEAAVTAVQGTGGDNTINAVYVTTDGPVRFQQRQGGLDGNTAITVGSGSLTNATWRNFHNGTGPYLPISAYVRPLPYMTDATGSISPYIDATSPEDAFANISSTEMRNVMLRVFTKGDILGRPGPLARSMPCGWDYENTPLGIDSLVYGGRKK